jgi:hypothetical protein|tara:strand:+ start:7663 stop:8100 length:438 start_codon:yes stop_codon:yes gene_type:complete
MAYRGKYKPKNPNKYVGDPTKINYRSLWERKCMLTFDDNPNIIKWASEEIAIPYLSPVDRKRHRYYPDFMVELKNKEGKVETIMIEVKPKKQTEPPKPRKRKSVTYLNEAKTYAINQAKWAAAQALCDRKGWTFRIMTEKEIYGK